MRHIARALVLLLCCASGSAADQQLSRGGRLEDALRVVQRAGLPIVFSSAVVKPSMRVVVEPHATTPRQQLDELLAPHGLKAEAGPGRVILVMRDRSSAARDVLQRSRPATRTHGAEPDAIDMSQDAAKYSDTVTVWGLNHQGVDRGGSETTLGGSAVRATSTVLSSDGLDA